jgi:nucleotide-binding universal stress UspA family protein
VGSPWQEIEQRIATTHDDLVVMGTHGRRGVNRMLLGSVAEKIVRTSTVPVLTVH